MQRLHKDELQSPLSSFAFDWIPYTFVYISFGLTSIPFSLFIEIPIRFWEPFHSHVKTTHHYGMTKRIDQQYYADYTAILSMKKSLHPCQKNFPHVFKSFHPTPWIIVSLFLTSKLDWQAGPYSCSQYAQNILETFVQHFLHYKLQLRKIWKGILHDVIYSIAQSIDDVIRFNIMKAVCVWQATYPCNSTVSQL